MATITSAQSGNWSATTTWVGGVVPTSADTAVAATGHVVAIDVDVTCVKVTQAGTGKFTLGNDRTLTAGVEANAGTFTSGGTVEVTATTSATITGAITGVSTTANSIAAVVITGTGLLTINGTVTGSSGTSTGDCASVYTNVTCSITINGSVSAGSGTYKNGLLTGASSNAILIIANGINNAVIGTAGNVCDAIIMQGTSPSVTITGNLLGGQSGAQQGSRCIRLDGASPTISVTGNITAGRNYYCHGIQATGSNANITVIGNLTGGLAGWAAAVFIQGANAVVNITGSLTGGTSGNAIVLEIGASPTLNVTGNITGGAGQPSIYATASNATISITGNVTGGTVIGSHGVHTTGNSSNRILSVIGTVTGTVSSSGLGSHGIYDTNTFGGWTSVGGSLIDSPQGDCAVSARRFRCIPTLNTIRQHANNTGFPNGTAIVYGSLDYIPNNIPIPANVRLGTVYGTSSSFTGTLAVPPASAVASGVPVDNTTGTAALRPSDIASLVGAQIAAAITSPGVA